MFHLREMIMKFSFASRSICTPDLGAANVQLDAATLAKLDALINQRTVVGSRYNAQGNTEVDTENF